MGPNLVTFWYFNNILNFLKRWTKENRMIFFSIMFQSSNQEYNSFILPNFLFHYLHSIVICTIYNKWYEQNIRTLWTSYIQYSFNVIYKPNKRGLIIKFWIYLVLVSFICKLFSKYQYKKVANIFKITSSSPKQKKCYVRSFVLSESMINLKIIYFYNITTYCKGYLLKTYISMT